MADRLTFLQLLETKSPLLADGAMGTMLHAHGVAIDACFDELNLAQPELVKEIHRAYLAAGAQILETNSFSANRYKLSGHGLEGRVAEINRAAVRLARESIGEIGAEALVAGSVGPLGVRLAPFGRVKPEQAFAAFREQVKALAEAGADLLVLETHTDLYELVEAVRAARSVGDLPIIASMTFTRDNRTLLGDPPAHVARRLHEAGADLIGANCSGGPAQLLRVLHEMRAAAPEARFSVMPNAGWPERVAGRIMYPANPDYFAEYARAFRDAGATVIGGCCGTTPDHIRSMRRALDSREPAPSAMVIMPGPGTAAEAAPATSEATRLAARWAEGRFVISVEVDPPRGFSPHKVLAGAHLLSEAGADVINVADSPMARLRMSPWAVCELIQRQVGLETVLHFTTRGRNLLRVQGDLLAAHALGVRNIFVVMGDPTAIGDYPEAADNVDVVPSGLIQLIKHRFNAGVDQSGADIGGATSFFVGCALNMAAQDLRREMRLLRKKIQCGADFAMTQPVFQPELVRQFQRRYEAEFGPMGIPILVGVLPLYNERHASFLHNEVPGIDIPEAIRRRMAGAGSQAAEEGVRIALELLDELADLAQGVYLMPAFSRYDLAAEIVEAVRRKAPLANPAR